MVTHFSGDNVNWPKVYAAKFAVMGPTRELMVWEDRAGQPMPIELKAIGDVGGLEMDEAMKSLNDRQIQDRRFKRVQVDEGGRGMRAFYYDSSKAHPDLPPPKQTGLPGELPSGKITFNLDGHTNVVPLDYGLSREIAEGRFIAIRLPSLLGG